MRISRRSVTSILGVGLTALVFVAVVVVAVASDRSASGDRLVYVWSQQMPLSVKGLQAAEAAATTLGVRFEPVDLESAHASALPDGSLPADIAGAELHVPSVALVERRGGADRVRTVLGYKTHDGLLRALEGAARVPPVRRRGDEPLVAGGHEVPRGGSDIRWVGEPEPGFPGFFYRMIPGTSHFVLDRGGRTYVHDTDSGERWTGPADLDLVPSPDAAFLVAPLNRGLAFYSWAELQRVGPAGGGADLPPFHLDREMDDQYPSIGILGEVEGGTHVRILVSWFAGVRVRDYVVFQSADGALAARPRGAVVEPCADIRLSTPILSPDGRRVSGRDESTATTKVFEIGASGTACREIADVGTPTSKATFSPSSRFLAFSRMEAGERRRVAQVYVLDLDSGALRTVPGATSTRLLIPDFGSEEEILILGVRDEMRFEIHCWRGACPG